jgi:hypothetical protein
MASVEFEIIERVEFVAAVKVMAPSEEQGEAKNAKGIADGQHGPAVIQHTYPKE